MKKLLLSLFLGTALVCAACSGTPVPPVQVQGAVFQQNSAQDVERILYQAVTRSKWQVRNREPGAFIIAFSHKGYVFQARVTYSATQYAISFVNSTGSTRNAKDVAVYYNKQITKLDRVIQKYFARSM